MTMMLGVGEAWLLSTNSINSICNLQVYFSCYDNLQLHDCWHACYHSIISLSYSARWVVLSLQFNSYKIQPGMPAITVSSPCHTLLTRWVVLSLQFTAIRYNLTSYPGLHPDFIPQPWRKTTFLHGCEIKSGWRPGYEVNTTWHACYHAVIDFQLSKRHLPLIR